MPIESSCQGCGRLLRVADEHAGKLARCPHCQTIYTVPSAPPSAPPPAFQPASPFAETASYPYPAAASAPFPSAATEAKPGSRWTLRTPDGQTFGPVPRGELDRWRAEGRITPQSQLLEEGTSQWLWAGQVFPQIQSFAADSPFAAGPGAPLNPYTPPPSGGAYNWPASGYRFREQHRGGAILAMSIVGILFCQFVAIASFIMAITDLGKMSKGTMDPAGRGLTIAGLVISSMSLVLFVVMIIIQIIAAGQ
jgi:hypothetical protein